MDLKWITLLGGDLNPILGFCFPLFSMVFPCEISIRVAICGKERKQNCSLIVGGLRTFSLRVLIFLYPFPVRGEHRIYFFLGAMRSVMAPSKCSAANATVSDRVRCGCTVRPMCEAIARSSAETVDALKQYTRKRFVGATNSSRTWPKPAPRADCGARQEKRNRASSENAIKAH